jgi:hypothetical protein
MTTYSKIEHGLYENPKIIGLSHHAFRTYIEAILYSGKHLTDGFIDERVARRMGWDEVANELTTNDFLNPSWQRVDGGWTIYGYSERQTSKSDVDAVREKKRDAANARWNKKVDAKVMQSASTVHYKSDTEAIPDIDTDIDTDVDINTNNSFETFWKTYPRKTAKQSALKVWTKLSKSKDFDPDEVINIVEAYSRSDLPEQKFIPHASTWLNQERWRDPLPAPALTRFEQNVQLIESFRQIGVAEIEQG